MKVCVIHDSDSLGGASLSMIDMIKMLSSEHDVIACLPHTAINMKKYLEKNNIEVYSVKTIIPRFSYYSGSKTILSRTVLKQLFSFHKEKYFVNEIENLNPDVIIFNSLVTSLSGRMFSKKITKICFVRETFRQKFIDNIFKNIFEKYFKGVCFIADHERKYLNLKDTLTEVIPDCLEPKRIDIIDKEYACSKENLDPKKKYILFLGGLDPIKGIDYLLKAMNKLSDNCSLIVAGNFDNFEISYKSIFKYWYNPQYFIFLMKTRYYFKKLEKRERIILTGFRDEISNLMNICEFIVFPARHPHQPRPLIEAGEFKKTAILPDYEATKEFFSDRINVLTYKPRNSIDLARKISLLLEDEALRQQLAEANYQMTRKNHNYVDTQINLQKFLKDCLSS